MKAQIYILIIIFIINEDSRIFPVQDKHKKKTMNFQKFFQLPFKVQSNGEAQA